MGKVRRLLFLVVSAISLWLLALAAPVSAHVVVKPAEVPTAASQAFMVSVPNERNVAMTGLKLEIPTGVQIVTPNAKAGWTVTLGKDDSGKTTTSITWSDGDLPAELRDDFGFTAQVPDTPSELHWKAYQTYADGVTVSWDQPQTADDKDDDAATSGPFSITKVVGQTSQQQADTAAADSVQKAHNRADFALYLAVAALGIATITLVALSRIKRG